MTTLSSVHYVAGLLFTDSFEQVLLVRKSHPKWMEGKLNGIGGHIELGESPLEAMNREWKEETQLKGPTDWKEFATVSGCTNDKGWIVHWFTTSVQRAVDYRAIGYADEPVNWVYLRQILEYNIPIMSNLIWLMFMAQAYLVSNSKFLEVIER